MAYQGNRFTCNQCKFFDIRNDGACAKSPDGMKVNALNNICNLFQPSIINPSSPPFDFELYFEWLANDYYRPYSIDPDNIIVGSAKLGELIIDDGRLAALWPTIYQPMYKMKDKPYCSVNFPKCTIEINGYKFTINYYHYRNRTFINNGVITFLSRYWKDKPRQKKYQVEYNATYSI